MYIKLPIAVLLCWSIAVCGGTSKADDRSPVGFKQSYIQEIGGSNFSLIHQSEYSSKQMDPKESCVGVGETEDRRSIVSVYNAAKPQINKQLQDLYRAGQRKISIVLWHFDNDFDYPNDMWCFEIKEKKGVLNSRDANNLREIITYISQLGFNQINVRFAPMDDSAPTHWQSWSEKQYKSNWKFIVNTRGLIVDELKRKSNSHARIMFDLGLELGGIWSALVGEANKSISLEYLKRIWESYASSYGTSDTEGFSFAPAVAGQVSAMISVYDAAGFGRPAAYGFDIYGDVKAVNGGDFSSIEGQIKLIGADLAAAGELHKELFIQETYFNSSEMRSLIDKASIRYSVPLKYIFQWPYRFKTTNDQGNVISLAPFGAYKPFAKGLAR